MSLLEQIFPSAPAAALEWPAELPDHLSPSSLKMWMRCREQWRRAYVLRERQRPSAAMIWGNAHNFALVETQFAQKITSGEDLTVDDVKLAFAESVDDRVENTTEEIEWDETSRPQDARTPAELKDKGVELAAAYHEQVSASVQPITIEEKFSLDVPGVPVPVIGRIDVTETGRTIDLKTGSKREMKPDNAFQGRVYQLARPMPMEFHLATKTKTPGIYTPAEWPEFGFEFSEAEQARTRMVVALLAADIVSTFERFGPDETWPGAFTYGWACGFCGFRPTCAYWAEQKPKKTLEFGEVSSSGRTPVELECDALTRSLFMLAEKRGNGEAVLTAVELNRVKHAQNLEAHVVWLTSQIARAMKAMA